MKSRKRCVNSAPGSRPTSAPRSLSVRRAVQRRTIDGRMRHNERSSSRAFSKAPSFFLRIWPGKSPFPSRSNICPYRAMGNRREVPGLCGSLRISIGISPVQMCSLWRISWIRDLRWTIFCASSNPGAPRSLKVCSLLEKPARRMVEVPIDYVGFSIPDEFVVGYGLDSDQQYRNLPYIAALKNVDESPGSHCT